MNTYYTDNFKGSESEEILREIKQTTDEERLEELWSDYYNAVSYEREEFDYTNALKK
jgi:hypothetical protein